MDVREFRYYQYLSELGYVEPIRCFDDSEHGNLLSNIDENDNLYLWCLACEYKLYPGIVLEELIKRNIMRVSKEQLNGEQTP